MPRTVKLPAAETVTLLPVVPLLHKYVMPATGEATLKTVLPPVQKLAVPEMLGVAGKAFTIKPGGLLANRISSAIGNKGMFDELPVFLRLVIIQRLPSKPAVKKAAVKKATAEPKKATGKAKKVTVKVGVVA
jgi:hypothetical protein